MQDACTSTTRPAMALLARPALPTAVVILLASPQFEALLVRDTRLEYVTVEMESNTVSMLTIIRMTPMAPDMWAPCRPP